MKQLARVLFGFIGGALALFGFIFLFTTNNVIRGVPNAISGIVAFILAVVCVYYGFKGK
jgi:hypothetical protein